MRRALTDLISFVGKPADEGAVELPMSCSSRPTDECQSLQVNTNVDCAKVSKFASECNLIVELPPEAAEEKELPPEGGHNQATGMHTRATQTPVIRKNPKAENSHWSFTYYDFEDERSNLQEDDEDDVHKKRTTTKAERSDSRRRRHPGQRSSRLTREVTADTPRSNTGAVSNARVKERLPVAASNGNHGDPVAVATGHTDETRVPRRSKRQSTVGGNTPAVEVARGTIPTRNETYPGGYASSNNNEGNDVSSLLVERGSEILDFAATEPLPRRRHDHSDDHTHRCPCMRKRGTMRKEKNYDFLQQLCGENLPYSAAEHKKTALPQSRDRCCRDRPSVRQSKIDRSCLCDDGKLFDLVCRSSPPEIVLRHEHHHYYHFPKSRSSGRRRTHGKS